MRNLAQMLAHVHDAEIEIGEGPEPPLRDQHPPTDGRRCYTGISRDRVGQAALAILVAYEPRSFQTDWSFSFTENPLQCFPGASLRYSRLPTIISSGTAHGSRTVTQTRGGEST